MTDANGDPIEGVDVTATHDASGESRTLTTGDDGIVVFSVLDGEFSLSAEDSSETVTVDGDTDTTLETEIQPEEGSDASSDEQEQDEQTDSEEQTDETDSSSEDNTDEDNSNEENETEAPPDEDDNDGDTEEPAPGPDPNPGDDEENDSEGNESPPGDGEENDDSEENESEENDSEAPTGLQTNTTMTVELVDQDGNPVQGEVSMGLVGHGLSVSEETNENGVATFENLPDQSDLGADSYQAELSADVEGYQVSEGFSDFTTVIQGGEDNTHTLDLVEEPTVHNVSVTVRDDETGASIQGAQIQANGGRLPTGGDKVFEGTTNDEGTYTTTAAEGQYEIETRHGGYSPDTQTVDIDGDTNIVFELDSHHLSPQPNESEANSSSGPNASEPNESGMNATAA
ncbi:carboxypeptidase-like regulatory domain-containing protein [Halalkalicoccus subterraneus]|uniref:carboxypeptidase-like regulatory domain-containing protein n=1 Tax=Halalkalicoccus subterraneus TaxID=2675002 RepID=UPI0013CEA7C8|nr:carboxypeptidase-like regulatory domain-containing protein [Halalkalicoccus subterraneus]